MSWLDIFRKEEKTTASLAKERLQVIVAHQRAGDLAGPPYLADLQKDILEVIRRYVNVGDDAVKIDVDRDGEMEVLELNIVVPES